jgi:hydrogenase expression/formation protein HypC
MCLAIPGKIVRILREEPWMRTAKVEVGGILKEVNVSYVPEAGVGDYVIVHVGFAISRVDEREARRVFEYLAEMEGLAELEPPG